MRVQSRHSALIVSITRSAWALAFGAWISVAFEAAYGWGWFADANLLPEAWIAPPAVRELHQLVRMRSSLVRIRSRLRCQVHAICADAGVPVPVTDLFGKKGRELLETLALPPITASRLAAHLRLVDDLAREIIAADREIVAAFRGDDRVRRLLPIPGIGILTAATIIAEVGDVARFPSADHLASWAGLTPTEGSSADHLQRGHISKQGSRWLRWAMVEAATKTGSCRWDKLHRFADPIAERRGTKIARVALARRILVRAFYALRDERAAGTTRRSRARRAGRSRRARCLSWPRSTTACLIEPPLRPHVHHEDHPRMDD
jgi:Transposase IS116/IS110/IS902 family